MRYGDNKKLYYVSIYCKSFYFDFFLFNISTIKSKLSTGSRKNISNLYSLEFNFEFF